jgi:hypothetical protein
MVGHAGLVIGGWYFASPSSARPSGRCSTSPVRSAHAPRARGRRIHRLSTAADYLGYEENQGVSLFNVKLGWAFVVSLMALFASAIYIAIELGRDGRRVRAR